MRWKPNKHTLPHVYYSILSGMSGSGHRWRCCQCDLLFYLQVPYFVKGLSVSDYLYLWSIMLVGSSWSAAAIIVIRAVISSSLFIVTTAERTLLYLMPSSGVTTSFPSSPPSLAVVVWLHSRQRQPRAEMPGDGRLYTYTAFQYLCILQSQKVLLLECLWRVLLQNLHSLLICIGVYSSPAWQHCVLVLSLRCCCMILTHFRFSLPLHSFHRRRCCRRFLFRRRRVATLAAALLHHISFSAQWDRFYAIQTVVMFGPPPLRFTLNTTESSSLYGFKTASTRMVKKAGPKLCDPASWFSLSAGTNLHNPGPIFWSSLYKRMRTQPWIYHADSHRFDRPVRHGFSFSQSAPSFIVSRQIPLYVSRALSLSSPFVCALSLATQYIPSFPLLFRVMQ